MATNITQEAILTDCCVITGVFPPNTGEAMQAWAYRVATSNKGRQALAEAAVRAGAADRDGCKAKLLAALQAEDAVAGGQ